MAYTKLDPRHSPNARVEEISRESSHYLLSIPAGKAHHYRLAQLDDYTQMNRGEFPHRSPLSLSLLARTSSKSIPGTWGFGLWNDPFGFSLGFGGTPKRLPALPNAVWFFGASEESYLSFREPPGPEQSGALSDTQMMGGLQIKPGLEDSISTRDRASSTGFAQNAQPSAHTISKAVFLREGGVAANGFLAQSFRAPKFHALLIPAGAILPFSPKNARKLLGRVIDDNGTRISVDATQWHRYRLDWRERRVSFEVDDALVFESPVSPHPPLGLVIWIDNQFAAFTPEGRIGFGLLENPEPASLEVRDIEVK